MKKRADSLKVLAAALVLGVLASTTPVQARDRDVAEPSRVTAIHDCNVEANKFNPHSTAKPVCGVRNVHGHAWTDFLGNVSASTAFRSGQWRTQKGPQRRKRYGP